MADPQNLETDLLIVGAGPVGLIAANALVKKSILKISFVQRQTQRV